MIINSIELKGHGSYRDHTQINIPLGITGIMGQYDNNPLKSNGVGKSTLVMSIIYALFGEGEFKVLKELVNDSILDDEMFVKIDFDLDGVNYFVERGMRGGSSYLDFRGGNVRRGDTDKIKVIQGEILKVLNMDYGMLTTSGFFEQNALDKFIDTEPETLRQYINKILGTELWRDVSKLTKKKNTKIDEALVSIDDEIDKLEIVTAHIEKELLNRVQIEVNIKKINDELYNERDTLSNLNILKSKIETLKDVKLKIQNLNEAIKSTEQDIVDAENKIKITKEYVEIKSKMLSELVVVSEKKINDKEDILNIKLKHRQELSDLLKDIIAKVNEAKVSLRYQNEKKDKWVVGKCFECEQDITQDYVNKKNEKISQKIQEWEQKVEIHTSEQDDLTDSLIELDDTISNLRQEVTTLKNSKNEYETNSKILKESIKNGKEIVSLAESSLEKLNTSLNTISLERNELENKKVKLQKEIPDGIDQKIIFAEQNITNLETTLNNLNIELGKLNQLEVTKLEHLNSIKENKEVLKKLKKESYIYTTLTRKYKDFARHKFEDSIVSIQNVANRIIQQVLPEMSVRFYEDDSKLKRLVIAFEIDKKERSYKRLSGGQKTIANIGLRLGFSKIVQARAKSNIEFVVLDEPFGALDENNRALVTRMLTVMLDWFKQIFVISHIGSMKEFPNIINVGMTTEGVSYIK